MHPDIQLAYLSAFNNLGFFEGLYLDIQLIIISQRDWGLYEYGVNVICGVRGWAWCLRDRCPVRGGERGALQGGRGRRVWVEPCVTSLTDKSCFWFYLNIVRKPCVTYSSIVWSEAHLYPRSKFQWFMCVFFLDLIRNFTIYQQISIMCIVLMLNYV